MLTDFAPHAMWVHPGVDQYYVATPEMARTMARHGLDPTRLQVTGIPIRQVFSHRPQRDAAALELGLDPARPTLLLMGGGLGLGPMAEMVAAAQDAALPLQILAVTGHSLMAASDLLISKPGAVTASEALAAMRRCAQQSGHPRAARHVIEHVSGTIQQPREWSA